MQKDLGSIPRLALLSLQKLCSKYLMTLLATMKGLSLCLCLSICLSLSLCVCVCVSLSLFLSLSLPPLSLSLSLRVTRSKTPLQIKTTTLSEPVWPSGKVLGWYTEGPRFDSPLRLSFLFKCCGLWTLSCDFVTHN